MDIIHKIKLDMQQNGLRQTLHVKQGDSMSRSVEMSLYSNGTAWQVPEEATILQIAYYKPDRTGGLYDTMPDDTAACSAAGNVVTARLHPQMFTVAGLVACELRLLTQSGAQISTFSWYMAVDAAVTNGIASEDYFKFATLDGLQNQIGDLSGLQTTDKQTLVAAVNEVLQRAVRSVNGRTPAPNGAVTIAPADIGVRIQANQYQGDLEGALEELASEQINLTDGVEALSSEAVKSINMKLPDSSGNVSVSAPDIQTQFDFNGKQIGDVHKALTELAQVVTEISGDIVIDKSEDFTTWVDAGNGSADVPRKYIETLADGDYRIVADGCEYLYHKYTADSNVWIAESQYPNDTVCYVSLWCNGVCAMSFSNDDGIIINDMPMASQEYVDGEIAKVNNKISALGEQIATIETMNPSSWADVQKIVRAGLGPVHFPVGWEFETLDADTGASIVWVVRGHDHHIPGSINLTHSMTLEMKYVYSTANGSYKAIQFDASEALYYAQDGLEPGTYYFTVANQDWFSSDNGKSYQFTLAKAVPAGGQICLDMTYNAALAGKSVKTYASPYATDAIETATLAESSEGAFLGTTDGSGNVNHMHRIVFGSNNYAQSAARQWLNSAAAAGGVWTPTNKFDRAPSWATSINGFLHGLPANFLEVVAPAIIPCRTCGVCECNSLDGTEFTVNQIYSLEDKFFLPSRPEIYGSWDSTSYKDGTLLDYYDGLTNAERQKYDNIGVARNAWLRSPFPSRGGNERIVPMESGVGNPAYASTGIAAACIIA